MNDSDSLVEGAIDVHVHSHPSLFRRSHSDLELARAAADRGMRGFVIKDHDSGTAGRAAIAQSTQPDVQIFGGLVMNRSVGGIDPLVVEANLQYGAKFIWFPTTHAQTHFRQFGGPNFPAQSRPKAKLEVTPVHVLDEQGRLTENARSVIEIIAHYDACLATGHLALNEMRPVLRAAREAGVDKIIVTHANWSAWKRDLPTQRELIEANAFLEYVAMPCVAPGWIEQEPEELAHWIAELGHERIVLSSDLGQETSPAPPDGFESFLRSVAAAGTPVEHIRRTIQENPATLLGL